MNTKNQIIGRLLAEGHINSEEAIELLRENVGFWNTWVSWTAPTTGIKPLHYENCPCNPKFGGSGVCGCILNEPGFSNTEGT